MDLIRALAEIVGSPHCSVPAPDWARIDFMGRRGGQAVAVVEPGDTSEASEVVRTCAGASVPIVVQGGNTGLVRGQLPAVDANPRPVILRTARLNAISDVTSEQLTAGGGVTIADLHARATSVDREYGVDLASRDSATVGGTIATNAGGIRVCAYGSTRNQVVGLEAVLADGTVISDLRGLAKDNTGYDLSGLLCGSEGTLAVVTAARLRLHQRPRAPSVVATRVPSLALAFQLATSGVAPGVQLLGAEIVDAESWAGLSRLKAVPDPLGAGHDGRYVLLLEVADGGTGEGFGSLIQDLPGAVVALAPHQRRALWQLREGQSEYWSTLGDVQKFDVSLPSTRLDEIMAVLRSEFRQLPDEPRWGVFGHIHEANLHIEVITNDTDRVDRIVLESVAALGGSISAEHGVGRDKVAWLHLRRTETELATMRAIKRALDPDAILNRGVLLP